MAKNEFKKLAKIIAAFKTDPVGVNRLLWPNELAWERQDDILRAVWENKYVCVKAANGVGKSFLAARIIVDYLLAWPNAKVISTAQTWAQVHDVLWDELRRQHALSRFPLGGKLTECRWEISSGWWAVGISTSEAGAFLGRHEDHIMVIMDEACGVPTEMDQASKSLITSANAKYVKISNPVEASGHFFDNFSSPLWHSETISSFDSPNFTDFGITEEDILNNTWKDKVGTYRFPRLVTPDWVWERVQEYGSDSGWYQCFVKGEFPTQNEDSLISLAWCMAAVRRTEVSDDRIGIGVDVARFGSDSTVIALYNHGKVEMLDSSQGQDLMRTVGKIKVYQEQYKCSVGIDDIGVGGGVTDRLRELEIRVIPFIANERAIKYGQFANRSTQATWAVREMLRTGKIILPNDNKLLAQLTARKYKIASDGQIDLETKDSMRKRGLSSPDRADAVAIAIETATMGYVRPTKVVERSDPTVIRTDDWMNNFQNVNLEGQL